AEESPACVPADVARRHRRRIQSVARRGISGGRSTTPRVILSAANDLGLCGSRRPVEILRFAQDDNRNNSAAKASDSSRARRYAALEQTSWCMPIPPRKWPFALMAVVGCLSTTAPTPKIVGDGPAVLFIGNSYTYVNDVPGIVQA